MAASTEPPQPQTEVRVDELRQQLRSLGYLDAGVDRFVLGPARTSRRPLAIAALASTRIGLLAAALLGPAAAIGISTRLPGLVRGASDALIVALYLALLFGLAAGAISFVASLVVARLPVSSLARRGRVVSRAAGAVVGGACLLYLTLWWRIATPDPWNLSSAWTASALLVAVAISFLLGHVTAITAFAVIVATHPEALPEVARRDSVWRLALAGAVLAFVGAGALLLMAAPAEPRDAPPPNLAVVSPGLRVRVIAIDGFDPAVMRTLAAEGSVPRLTAAAAGGVTMPAGAERDPAREWTTIATGQRPEMHGIHGLETRRVAGLQGSVASGTQGGLGRALRGASDMLRLTRPSTASGAELRSKTMWEVAADAGLRTAVVNWWATWPAAAGGTHPPIVISDRATLRLERGGALDGEISPPAVYERLRQDWPAITRQAESLITSLLPPASDPSSDAALRRAAEVDALQVVIASRLPSVSLDLLAIYLPGLDIAQHALLGSGESLGAAALQARLAALRGYYLFLDRLLGEALTPAADELVVVITQPGRIRSIDRGLMSVRGVVAGPQGSLNGQPVDVAPTILHALGVPLSQEVAGVPLLSLFSKEFAARFPVREVASYGERAAPGPRRDGEPLDQEMIERLRSLGYVR